MSDTSFSRLMPHSNASSAKNDKREQKIASWNESEWHQDEGKVEKKLENADEWKKQWDQKMSSLVNSWPTQAGEGERKIPCFNCGEIGHRSFECQKAIAGAAARTTAGAMIAGATKGTTERVAGVEVEEAEESEFASTARTSSFMASTASSNARQQPPVEVQSSSKKIQVQPVTKSIKRDNKKVLNNNNKQNQPSNIDNSEKNINTQTRQNNNSNQNQPYNNNNTDEDPTYPDSNQQTQQHRQQHPINNDPNNNQTTSYQSEMYENNAEKMETYKQEQISQKKAPNTPNNQNFRQQQQQELNNNPYNLNRQQQNRVAIMMQEQRPYLYEDYEKGTFAGEIMKTTEPKIDETKKLAGEEEKNEYKIKSNLKFRLIQFIFEFVLICVLMGAFGAMGLFYTPRNAYIACTDNEIMYPLLSEKITLWMAALYCIIPMLVAIFVLELVNSGLVCGEEQDEDEARIKKITKGMKFKTFLICVFHAISLFGLGLSATLFISELCKRFVGRPRPNFIQACSPNLLSVNFTMNTADSFIYKAVETDKFCGGAADDVKNARLSFPSSHASLSAFCMLFMIIYLEARFVSLTIRYVKAMMQITALLVAFITSCIRVADYHNRFSDVIAGALIGSTIALLVTLCQGRVFLQFEVKQRFTDFYLRNEAIKKKISSPAGPPGPPMMRK